MKVTVKPTPRLGKGQKGLFSKRPIQKGEMVISMNRKNLAKYSKKRWGEIHKASSRLPHDGAIEARGKMVTDWTTGRTPTWYRLNHSRRSPNVEMRYTSGLIAWYAKRDIKANVELLFNYGDTPPEWG